MEFYRTPGQKDHQGWRGPGELLKVDDDGTTHIKWQGSSVVCRLQDVRRALLYFLFATAFFHAHAATSITPMDYLCQHVQNMIKGAVDTIAIIHTGINYQLTKSATRYPQLFQAILHVAACDLHLAGCVGARLARGVSVLKGSTCEDSLHWYWIIGKQSSLGYHRLPGHANIDCKMLNPHKGEFTQLCHVRFHLQPLEDIPRLMQ